MNVLANVFSTYRIVQNPETKSRAENRDRAQKIWTALRYLIKLNAVRWKSICAFVCVKIKP